MALEHARSFKELRVYQKARGVSQAVFKLSRQFPKEEMYSLTDQLRRAARSIGDQIAEAWGKRCGEKHFVSKLTDADAEQLETQHWLTDAVDCGYLSSADASQLNSTLEEIGRMLNSIMAKADAFCGSPGRVVREDATGYFTTADD